MDIQEQLHSTIYMLSTPPFDVVSSENREEQAGKEVGYFLEVVTHTHSRSVDYWLGSYGSDRRVWLGSADRMTVEEAKARAAEIINRG